MRVSLCNILGFQSTPNIGKYLGIPIKHSGPSANDFNFVLDRVKQKLSGWKLFWSSMYDLLSLIMLCNVLIYPAKYPTALIE